jgi:hypothetical protein
MGGKVATVNDASRTFCIAIAVIVGKQIGRLRMNDMKTDCQIGSQGSEPAVMAENFFKKFT